MSKVHNSSVFQIPKKKNPTGYYLLLLDFKWHPELPVLILVNIRSLLGSDDIYILKTLFENLLTTYWVRVFKTVKTWVIHDNFVL